MKTFCGFGWVRVPCQAYVEAETTEQAALKLARQEIRNLILGEFTGSSQFEWDWESGSIREATTDTAS